MRIKWDYALIEALVVLRTLELTRSKAFVCLVGQMAWLYACVLAYVDNINA